MNLLRDRSPQSMAEDGQRAYGAWPDAKLLALHARLWAKSKKASEAEWQAMKADAPRGRQTAARVKAQRAAEAETVVRLECQRRGLEVKL